jgi:hypothetical protein
MAGGYLSDHFTTNPTSGELLRSRVVHTRFVVAWAIDLKLCTYVPLGHMTYQTQVSVRFDSWLGHQGPKLKTQKVLELLDKLLDNPQIFIRGISSKDT